jgi:hypothetical protein
MTKQEILERLCDLCTRVMAREFGYLEPADCFCKHEPDLDFRFSPKVLQFIEEAVEAHLER